MKILSLLLATGCTWSAHATAGIEGTWKMTKSECLSGAPYVAFSPQMSGTADVFMTITEKEIRSNLTMHVKYEKKYAEDLSQQARDVLAGFQPRPEGPEKQKAIAEITQLLAMVQQYAKGVTCLVEEVTSYTLSGSTFRAGSKLKRSSTCPGDFGDEANNKGDVSTIEASETTLKVTDQEPETERDSSCPVGDKSVNTYTRIK